MPAQLNHLIVQARDSQASARFLANLLGLPGPTRFGPFFVVATANGVSMDPARSITAMADAASTSRIRTGTSSRFSPAPMAAVAGASTLTEEGRTLRVAR